MNNKVFCIPDTHFPFQDKKAIKKVIALIKKEKPTHIIQLGDLLDFYTLSRYDKDLNLITPEIELKKALDAATNMWKAIRKAAPKAKCYQLIGNHEARLTKKVMSMAPEVAIYVKSIKDLLTFEGVKTFGSYREHLELFGVIYTHGFLSKSLDHAKHFNKPVVHGHTHRASLTFEGSRLWSMECGFLADEEQAPLQYTQSKMSKWTLAVGIVQNGTPTLIRLK